MYENKKKSFGLTLEFYTFLMLNSIPFFFYPFPWLLGLLGSDAVSRELQ